jgi:REP element-mobilizing transposase RayT
MPVYFFSFHAYRSWLPDHRRGYTQRGKGYLRSDPEKADEFEERAKHEKTIFTDEIVRAMIEELIESCSKIDCRLHGAGSDETHIHGLVSWKYQRGWMSVRKSLKTSLTKRLNQIEGEHLAFSRGGSRKQVRERKHFDHLMETYLPGHRGWAWYEDGEWVYQRGQTRKKRKSR